ncbi:hypothetical protein SERLA73DRAFT_117784 [Serpula lacrymans var. lacrymans S7.3]|uniref:Complex 1 LYR protein domain-containing protein n=2 Tax=Serpula lacrymans var. lacrymans TaxID=341189 RepID=F8QHU8_SERL3|nr:uncharacterized protein SERLADRAFT_439305 [Serpula lacrymans var. lacrymans S7.9]EGN92144.1 hypothetical protein SERLA73DRAFT_117784 [Serpula lacrymans var. lacrymans S7.3]EGO23997.1 hypothetical protein SERLADRAFT_439305 [Serpula lacrymans var. lacrymans S7.9]
MSTKSGLQREVLSLYRRALRMVRTKPPATQPKFRLFVQHNFRILASSISPRDVEAIEHLLRRGRRQIEMYEDHAVKDCWVSQEMRDWAKEHWPKRDT